jgi:FkbM family methyltransferase
MYYSKVFNTKSFHKAPIATLFRGAEWAVREMFGTPVTINVPFGSNCFRMRLQSTKRNVGSAGIFVQREYYEPLLEFGHKYLPKNSHVIDGGANQGIFTCAFASAVGPGGRVYAFEPQNYAVECIKENLKLNNFTNVDIFAGAISNEAGLTYLNLDHGPVSASISSDRSGDDVICVTSYSIDDLFIGGKISSAQFIKLDVEGAELLALRGANALLEKERPHVCVEALNNDSYQLVAKYLSTFGYRPYVFGDNGDLKYFDIFSPSANVLFMSARV